MSDSIRALANLMVSRKKARAQPYTLFLGAGVSISSGCSNMMQIVDDVLEKNAKSEFCSWENEIENASQISIEFGELLQNDIGKKKRVRFFEIWEKLDQGTQYAILKSHLFENKNPSEGYDDLIQLIKNGFIETVFSTNLDTLLERALTRAGLIPSVDFVVVVNGRDSPEVITQQINSSYVPIKIIKLHGSLEFPTSYAFSQKGVFDFENQIKPIFSQLINQSLIIVGYSGQDRDIDVLFEKEGNEIHFISPTTPSADSRIYQILVSRGRGEVIDGANGVFDSFFKKLLEYTKEMM